MSKQTLYILHGWAVREGTGNQEKWQEMLTALKKNGIKPVFLKIPGLSAPLDEVWTLDDFSSWLGSKLKGKENVMILGHSFGGQLAIRYSAAHQDQVSRLVLIDPAGIRDMAFKPRVKRTVFLMVAKLGKLLFKADIFRKTLYKMTGERDYQNAPPLLRRSMSNILDDEVLDDLPNISCPTQLIWGRNDTATPFKNAQIMKDSIKGSKLYVVEDARHSPHFTHTNETAVAVAKFINSSSLGHHA